MNLTIYKSLQSSGKMPMERSPLQIEKITNHCSRCEQPISPGKQRATCTKCEQEFHLTKACAGIQASSWMTKPIDSRKTWRCKECRVENSSRDSSAKRARHDLSNEYDSVSDQDCESHSRYPTLAQIKALLDNTLDTKLQSMEEKLISEIASVRTTVMIVQKENEELKKRVQQLESTLANVEQYSRRSNVIVSNIPIFNNESPELLAEAVSKVAGVQFQPWEVVAAHRLQMKSQNKPPAIIMKFHNRVVKEKLIKVSREKQLTAEPCGGSKNTRVYISHHYTKATMDLRDKVRARLIGWKYVWIGHDGRILARRDDGERSVRINNEDDLEKYK